MSPLSVCFFFFFFLLLFICFSSLHAYIPDDTGGRLQTDADETASVPTEAESRIMDMARVLGEIRAQNTELRVMMGDVARRVTALEGRSGGQTTAPGGDEEEPVKAG